MPIVSTDNGSIHVEDQGAGVPLVFIPGLGGDARAFAVVARQSAGRFRTIVFDPRDAGRSFRAVSPYSTADMANDIAQVLDALELPPAHVVGHSLGGLVAQELGIARPDRVRSLVLASTHAGANPWRKALVSSWILLRHRLSAGEFARVTLPWLVAPRFYLQSNQVEGLSRFAEKNEWPQAPEAFERQALAAVGHEAKDRVGRISVPTLVLGGESDLVNPPPIAGELASLIPNARMEVLEGVGHMPHIENGPLFRSRIESFLDGTA